MVAEQLVSPIRMPSAMMLHDGDMGRAMAAGGYVFCFPSWDVLENMKPEELKQLVLSKKHQDDKHYLAMISGQDIQTHRGRGAVPPHLPEAPQAQAQSESAMTYEQANQQAREHAVEPIPWHRAEEQPLPLSPPGGPSMDPSQTAQAVADEPVEDHGLASDILPTADAETSRVTPGGRRPRTRWTRRSGWRSRRRTSISSSR